MEGRAQWDWRADAEEAATMEVAAAPWAAGEVVREKEVVLEGLVEEEAQGGHGVAVGCAVAAKVAEAVLRERAAVASKASAGATVEEAAVREAEVTRVGAGRRELMVAGMAQVEGEMATVAVERGRV